MVNKSKKKVRLTDNPRYYADKHIEYRKKYPVLWCIEIDGKKYYFKREQVIEKKRLNHIKQEDNHIVLWKP